MMEFDEIVVKESPGLCRCCLSEGCYKDLGTEYTWMNETEVYADMLLECFDISITQHNEGPNGPNRLICEVCITRLRDACNFKKQVMDSEKKFIDMIGRGEFRPKMLIYQTQMKCEDPNAVVNSVEDADIEYLEDDIDFGDDDPKDELSQPSVSEPQVAVTTLPVKGKRGRPRKNTPVKPDKRAKVAKLDDKAKMSKAGAKGNDDTAKPTEEPTTDPQYVYVGSENAAKKRREAEKQRKDELAKFMTIIIENTSILPFRWSANKYMCFYCCCDFLDSAKLKEHTIEEHKGANLKNVLRTLVSSSRVKLDTSQMICKKCDQQFQVFDEMLKHLATTHEFKFDTEIGKCLLTFNLSDDCMSCNECGQDDFRFFATLLKHAHKFHNKNKTFLCEICGQGFVGRANMTSHIKNLHKNKELKCDKCEQVFKNYYTLQVHLDQVHKTESLKCPKCPEILTSQYMKKRHLATVHDVKKLQFTCDQCDLVYTMKSRLVQHQQRTHLKTKTVTCEICGFKVFNNDLLKRHMVRHDDNFRPYECQICERAFQRKKTLNIHLRIHMDDKRFACRECGKAFVQVTSWKLHMRVHHGVEGAVWN